MNFINHQLSLSPLRWTAAVIGVAAVWFLMPEIVQAAVTFGEIGENVAENAKGVAKGVTLAGYASGAGTKRQGESTYPGGLIKILVGAVLLGLGETLGSGSATLFGADQTSGMSDLGL